MYIDASRTKRNSVAIFSRFAHFSARVPTLQDVIDASIDKWHVRLKACVHSGGGRFEHML